MAISLLATSTYCLGEDPSQTRREFGTESVEAFARQLADGAIVAPPPQYRAAVDGGESSVPWLVQLLDSQTHEDLRLAALFALQEITNLRIGNSPSGFPSGATAWHTVASEWRAWWERNRGRRRAEWLIDTLASPEESQRITAVQALGRQGDPRAIPVLRKVLDERGIALRTAAVEALARLRDPAAIPGLIDLYLSHATAKYRSDGVVLLRGITGETLGFEAGGRDAERRAAIQRWKQWWSDNRRRLLQATVTGS